MVVFFAVMVADVLLLDVFNSLGTAHLDHGLDYL